MRFMLKLLALLAVLLMPLGMTAAPAAAPNHHHGASMPMQHCPQQGPKQGAKAGFVECTMACSAALPANDLQRDGRLFVACVPEQAAIVKHLHGLHPDTATPPPKRS